ncbi:MAG: bifunctional (p)ppGpp synthetase/guanosine-3',5'-bis(diphosphate) 3'-pyrophosphohydrolase [Myxococcota bacterium]
MNESSTPLGQRPASPSEPARSGAGAGEGFARLRATVASHHPQASLDVLDRAATTFAALGGLASPPVAVGHATRTAGVLAGMKLDPAAVAAAMVAPLVSLLDRDVLPAQRLEDELGTEVATLLDGVRRLSRVQWDRIDAEAAETLRRMFLAMARDVRVVLVVLATRVQGQRRLHDEGDAVADEEERVRFARETLDVFAPLANRLGIWQLKWELEDGAFRTLEPEKYRELATALAEGRDQRDAFVTEVRRVLSDKLRDEGIEASVTGRAKHLFSIHKKMQRKALRFDQVMDISALRVITERVNDCYAVLGLVHSTWTPLPAEFDDYIARPKDNGYQSLHTAVIGPEGRPFEVQIRTREMHELSEFGVAAAHWAYKEGTKEVGVGAARHRAKFTLLRQLLDWERDVADAESFVASLQTDLFEDQVYVFTPQGDVVDLPVGATPLDFAYRIHTMVGHRCRGARVNDEIKTLDYTLQTGDRVEILTHKRPQPSRDWMNPAMGYVKTSGARSKIRTYFREQGRESAIAHGKDQVDRELARLDLTHCTREHLAARLKYERLDDLYAAVGYGDRSQASVASAALGVERDLTPPEEVEEPLPPSVPDTARRRRGTGGLRLDGVDDVVGRRARCCHPVPGDDVVGFVSRGRGVVIHRRDCTTIARTREPERLVEIDWGGGHREKHPVEVQLRANDRKGLLGEISNLVGLDGVDLTAAKAERNREGIATMRLSLEFGSAEQVVKVLGRLGQHPDVFEVRRIGR